MSRTKKILIAFCLSLVLLSQFAVTNVIAVADSDPRTELGESGGSKGGSGNNSGGIGGDKHVINEL